MASPCVLRPRWASRRGISALGVRHSQLRFPGPIAQRAGCISRRPRRPNLLVKLSPFRAVGRTVGQSARVEACELARVGILQLSSEQAHPSGPCWVLLFRLLGPGCPATGMRGDTERMLDRVKERAGLITFHSSSRPRRCPACTAVLHAMDDESMNGVGCDRRNNKSRPPAAAPAFPRWNQPSCTPAEVYLDGGGQVVTQSGLAQQKSAPSRLCVLCRNPT